ncbi:SdrD B-like domain-containing protein [Mucilaginibacter jinjuensis]|uniref:SdrD B-like domain-containing protein n=1 Tax=Mucilaginibacter jinjuensis TaxID=1176721 RepID=A0ABY7T1W8_9SPHI|nr:SdrD B-like domain-containing protein [Mucilaginibacter jinjuensis]WCT10243.1 SdrD B-like domain-containing protein [Mucilaginibacter jinjuensis]
MIFIEFPFYSFSQSTGVSCSFISDTVVVGYGQTFSNKIRFENKTSQAITLFQSTTTADVLLKLPDTVRLNPGASATFPVKYFASQALLSGSAGGIKVGYTNQLNGQKVEAFFMVKVNQPNKIFINLPEPIVYLNSVTGLANFKLHCANRGFSSVNVNLKLTINPSGIQIVTPIRNIVLDASSDQMIEFEAKLLSGNTNYSTNYNVTIECTDDNGNSLAIATLQIAEIGNNKREQTAATGQYFNQLSNTAELSYTAINRSYSFYSFLANGNIAPNADSHLGYNLNLNYYDKQHALDGYNTWLNYNNKYFGVTVGNLMESLDYSLFGRGAKASVFLDQHNSVDLYYVQNSYVLFSQLLNQYPGSTIFAASYNFINAGNMARVSLLYSHNPLTGVDTRFTNGYMHFALKGNQRLDVKAGYSNEQEPSTGESHNGVAGGFVYSYRPTRWDLSLNNYYSSAYYSGLQRGTTQLDNFLGYHFTPKTTLFGHYELIKNSPKYLIDTLTIAGFYNNTLKYELGLNLNFRALNITLHPYWYKQDINQTYSTQYIQVNGPLSSKSIRTGLDINYALGRGQQLTALTDFGYTRSDNPQLTNQHYTGFRINTNYFNKWWGMSVLLQNAPYYLAEEIATTYNNQKQRYHNYSFGPNVHFTAFNNKLSVSANDYLNFTSYNIKRNNALNGQVYYRVKGGWQLSGQVFYNTYPSYVNSYNLQTRVGISKQFIRTSTPGTHSLQLQFFDDENNDGIFNSNDKAIEGLVINIAAEKSTNNSDLTTISDKSGVVKYSNLQNAVYELSVVRGNGWHLAQKLTVDLVHNQKMMIPLVRSGWLKGVITPVKQEYTTSKPNLEGLRVVAVDDKNQTFTTLTNEFGEFELALPVNNYRISVDVDNQKYSISNPNQVVFIDQKVKKEVTFSLVDQAHKVIVKQF